MHLLNVGRTHFRVAVKLFVRRTAFLPGDSLFSFSMISLHLKTCPSVMRS